MAFEMLRSYGDQDSLCTFTPLRYYKCRSKVIAIKLYRVVISTSLDRLRYILYTRSVSLSSLLSGFKLELLTETAAATKFHSYRPYIAVHKYWPCQHNDEEIGLQIQLTVCGELKTMAHLLRYRLLDEPCSPEDLTIIGERATAGARMWQHLV